jgi:hypothetical protein
MAGDEPVRGIAIAMLTPALGQHVFFLRFEHREPPDFIEIVAETGFGLEDRQRGCTGHDSALSYMPPETRQAIDAAAPRADGALLCDCEIDVAAATLPERVKL